MRLLGRRREHHAEDGRLVVHVLRAAALRRARLRAAGVVRRLELRARAEDRPRLAVEVGVGPRRADGEAGGVGVQARDGGARELEVRLGGATAGAGGVGGGAEMVENAGSEAEKAGAAIGTGIGAFFVIMIWALGDIILGMMYLFTKP